MERGICGEETQWYFQLDHTQIKPLSNIKLTVEERSVPGVVESVY